jgi:small subunit ribosomal protein S1
MSTPDTPSQNQSPDDSAAHSPAPNESSPTGDSPGNGHDAAASPAAPAEPEHAHAAHAEGSSGESHGDEPPAGDEEHDEAGEAGGETGEVSEGSTPAAGAAGAQPGEKKRRRRRRRKKGDKAGAEGATASPVEGESAPAEGEAAKPDRPEKREPRREKKSGPPRERPPVNAGDIVFGKILEIDDEAILIDIPGKARAVFDRREMLISDEDESNAQAAPAAPHGVSEATAPAEPPAEPPPADAATATAVSVPAETSAEVAAAPAAETAPPVEPVHAEAAPREPAVAEPAPREPDAPREPKVPRVILEVGADFIGVVHNDGARGGLVVLTHHPKRLEKAKGLVEKASVEKTTILGLVTGVIKGGIEVDVDGLRAFAPGSHVDLRLGADLSHLVAKRLPFYVTQYAKRGRDVVLSRRAMLEDESRKARSEALAKLKVGEEIEGIVRSVVPFGAFVDVGGVEGLVPLQEMSHNRGDGPSDVFKAGEPTRVVVTKIDDKGKIWLSHKATIPDPWQQVAQKYATGTRHAGKVVRLQPFGAFIELEPGVDGLLHTQDLSVKRIETPDEVVKVGDAIEVTVAHVDPSNHKIALHPALQGDAANEAPQKVAPHKPVKAKIVAIESGGLVVRLLGVTGRNARGYVTSAGTGTPRGTELRKAFKVDQLIDAKVIEMDPRRGEVKLSIKALSEDQERSAYQQYRQQLKAEARFTFGDLLAKKGNPPR